MQSTPLPPLTTHIWDKAHSNTLICNFFRCPIQVAQYLCVQLHRFMLCYLLSSECFDRLKFDHHNDSIPNLPASVNTTASARLRNALAFLCYTFCRPVLLLHGFVSKGHAEEWGRIDMVCHWWLWDCFRDEFEMTLDRWYKITSDQLVNSKFKLCLQIRFTSILDVEMDCVASAFGISVPALHLT